MKPTLCVLSALLLASGLAPARAQDRLAAPSGWTKSRAGTTSVFTRGVSQIKLSAPQQVEDLAEFLKTRIAADARFRGKFLRRGQLQRTSNGALTVLFTFEKSVVAYGAIPRRDGARFLVVSSPDNRTLSSDLKVVAVLAQQLKSADSGSSSSVGSTTPVRKTPVRNTSAYQGTPGKQYLKTSQIAGVYLKESWTTGVGGMMILEYAPVMLLRDGTAFEDFDVPPTELNVASFKKSNPRDWGKWTRTSKGLSVRFNGDKSSDDIKPSFKTLPAKSGQKLSGTFTSIGGGGNTALGGDVMIAVSNSYRFFPNGRFATDRAASGNTPDSTTLSTSKEAGTYSLSGHTLVLKFNGGRVVRKMFYFYPDKGKSDADVLGIGDSAFIKQK